MVQPSHAIGLAACRGHRHRLRARAQRELAGPLRQRDKGSERGRLGPDLAAIAPAEAAIAAGLPAAVIGRDDGARNGKDLQSQLLSRRFNQLRRRMGQERRQRERLALRLRRPGSRDADDPLDLVIPGLELFISNGPIRAHSIERPGAEVLGPQAEEVSAHMHGAAADAAGDLAFGAALRGAAVADHHVRVIDRVGHEEAAPADGELVVDEVALGVVRALLQQQHAHAGAGERPGRRAPAGARADDDGVSGGHGAGPAR